MESSVSAADFYRRQASQQPPSNDWYLICIAIAYTSCHGADDAGKKSFHCIMRYLLTVELVLTLLASVDVTLLMLVVRIMVLICAFFNAEFIPKSTKKLWVMACEQAPVVWQWLRDNAPVVWQGLREQLSDVRQYLAEQSVATERGGLEDLVLRERSRSPHGRASSQGVEQEIEPDTVMQAIEPEPSAEEEGDRYQLVCVPSNEPQVPRVVAPAVPHPVQAFQMHAPDWTFWRKNPPKKRNRDKDLEPERADKDEDLEPERAGKKPRT